MSTTPFTFFTVALKSIFFVHENIHVTSLGNENPTNLKKRQGINVLCCLQTSDLMTKIMNISC